MTIEGFIFHVCMVLSLLWCAALGYFLHRYLITLDIILLGGMFWSLVGWVYCLCIGIILANHLEKMKVVMKGGER